jgi:hypothetical protein
MHCKGATFCSLGRLSLKQRNPRITPIEEEFFAQIRGIRAIRGSRAFGCA